MRDSIVDWPALFLFFAAWLRHSYSTRVQTMLATTIEQYVCHVANHLIEGVVLSTTTLRNVRFPMLIDGFKRDDGRNHPLRFTAKIPFTADMVMDFCKLIREEHLDEETIRSLDAAIACGYGLSLRPGEYLYVSRPREDDEAALADKSFFYWPAHPNDFFCVCYPARYPTGTPSFFISFLDRVKNDYRGRGGPRCVAANPTYDGTPGTFCCVRMLYEGLRRAPPLPGSLLLSGFWPRLTDALISKRVKLVAVRLGLDPERVVPHSLRVAGCVQLSRFSDATRCTQGNWKTVEGMLVYARGSLQHATAVASDLHDPSIMPTALLQLSSVRR
jgi:hypothetical protein